MKIVPFEPEHALSIRLQEAQRFAISELPLEYLTALKYAGTALTAIHQGEVICCAGIARTDGYGTLWAYLAKGHPHAFISLHKKAVRLIQSCELQHLEATVQKDFKAGERWLKLLGFKMEKPLPNYVLGQDHTLWVR